jgi:hypothetical protein
MNLTSFLMFATTVAMLALFVFVLFLTTRKTGGKNE